MHKKWVAYFSQTGQEICDISNRLNHWPDLVVTNRKDLDGVTQELLDKTLDRLVIIPNRPTVAEYISSLTIVGTETTFQNETGWLFYPDPQSLFVTLHGYLRIIPASVCNIYEFWNGHPGLITCYPELKGKDPQEKIWKNMKDYPTIGSVVHRVTPKIDDGEIVQLCSIQNNCQTKEEIYDNLRKTSLIAWISFLKNRFL